jgi:RimJ/RimL family protein N-acetyltransferase
MTRPPRAWLQDKTGRPFLVRAYEAADRVGLEAMYEDFDPKRAAQGLPPDKIDALRRWLDTVLAQGHHLVVEVAGRVLGHVMLIPMNGRTEMASFLHQSIRGRGIGTAAHRVALDVCRAAGRHHLWLSVRPMNRAAIRSYEKVGFLLLPGGLWEPEVEMELLITP